ncbi:MAG: right-handed parallel beta-helix repeat-containing protein [Anaerolineae bacterium]|nr:right-handed parallel beta-helix repeat-containing protein [Anaerolineae bacterium]
MRHGHRWLIGVLAVVALMVAPALIVTGGQGSLVAVGTIYVDADATGANNGTSWVDAFTDLQSALDVATSGDQIWVAEGIYKPTVEHGGSGGRYRSFQLMNGVALYGGFAGTESSLGKRDWVKHVTVFSGDLNGDDGPGFTNNDENSYHVFYNPEDIALNGSAILDGVTVTGGNANGDYSAHHNIGGGMYNHTSSPTLANCTFSGNYGAAGAGMLNFISSPTLTNCMFSGNHGSGGGGIHNAFSSSPTLTNCTFSNNSAGQSGGGMYNHDSSPTVVNCTFSDNLAEYYGGGMYNYEGSSPAVINCILWGDTPEEIYNRGGSSPVVTYSDIQGGYDGTGNIDRDPLFLDPTDGDFHLSLGSPCIDSGNNTAPDLPEYDFEGDARIRDGDGNVTRIVDMGVDEVAVDWPYFHIYLPVALRGY